MPLKCQVVHAVSNRVRLRVPAIKAEPQLGLSLEAYLEGRPELSSARVSKNCASVTVTYDPSRSSFKEICNWFRVYRPKCLEDTSQRNGTTRRCILWPPRPGGFR
jgi:hypothetical protein